MSDDASPYAGTSPVASLTQAGGTVTLVEGQCFCVSDRRGDIADDLPHGLFLFDTRVLSTWEVRLDGHRLEPLAVDVRSPFSASFVGRSAPVHGHADSEVVVFRHRHVGQGMRERVTVTNHGVAPVTIALELRCDVDFADLFEVKESRVRRQDRAASEPLGAALRFGGTRNGSTKSVTVRPSTDAAIAPGRLEWRLDLESGGSREICVEVGISLDGVAIEPRFTCAGEDEDTLPARRMESWHAALPVVETENLAFAECLARSAEDLGALRIFDPEHPELPILAAGAPWFMTLFGRDSLLTAWMTLVADPTLAHGVLETLARFQGADVDASTEEEPGRILHEMRFGGSVALTRGGGRIYYGSVDATPLFVMLLGELRRWDPRDELVDRLLPHADRALAWIEEFGDADGDGYVEYQRRNPRGLVNQGWKDSWDGVRHLDGRPADTPIALCEVQGYVYAAYVARAHLARDRGDEATHDRWVAKALELRRRFNEDFWIEEHGWFALGLDRDKQQIAALASNVGHCLWTGIIDAERAGAVAARLMSPAMFSGFGVRTLAASMPTYNPVSYHNGSVWPHDNALCAAGLARYGFVDEAHRIITAQLAVADAFHGRLPELFAGFGRDQVTLPAVYPTSCSPQAWASSSPLLWLRTLLRLDPWASHERVWIDPQVPDGFGRLHVAGIEIGEHQLSVTIDEGRVTIDGASGLEVVRHARPPLSAAFDPRSS